MLAEGSMAAMPLPAGEGEGGGGDAACSMRLKRLVVFVREVKPFKRAAATEAASACVLLSYMSCLFVHFIFVFAVFLCVYRLA